MQPVHCSPSAFGLLLHRNRSLALLSAAGLPSAAPANPSQRLWPTPAAQPCLRQAGAWGESPGTCSPCSYGLPKATLGILHRLQTLPRGCKTLPSALPSPAASNPSQRLWSTPASQPCLRQAGAWGESLWNVQPVHCGPSAFGLLLHRNRSLALLSAAGLPSAAPANPPQRLWPTPAPQPCPLPLLGSSQAWPLLFLWASKSDVRHFAPPLNPPRGVKPFPAPLAYSCIAALPCLCVRREPGERASGTCIAALPAPLGLLLHRSLALFSAAGLPLLFLWASKSDVRHFGLPSNPPQRLQTLCSAFKPSAAPLAYSCTAALPSSRQQACPPQRSNPPQRETLWNRTLQP